MGNDLRLRRWSPADCRTIYDWRMHADSRRNSINQQEFSYSDHQIWFNRVVNDPAIFCYILEEESEPLAQIRFEPAQLPGCYRISVSVAPGKTGKGLGGAILRMASQQQELLRMARLLIAETLLENVPSQKIFNRQGFFRIAEVSGATGPYCLWVQPIEQHPLPPVPMQMFAPLSQIEKCEAVLTRTGLGQLSDQSAVVKIFFDDATCSDVPDGSMVFHLNNDNAGENILDLANGFPMRLSLPVTFADSVVAVAQIAAAVKYISGAEK